jgi:hypothetical protein
MGATEFSCREGIQFLTSNAKRNNDGVFLWETKQTCFSKDGADWVCPFNEEYFNELNKQYKDGFIHKKKVFTITITKLIELQEQDNVNHNQ